MPASGTGNSPENLPPGWPTIFCSPASSWKSPPGAQRLSLTLTFQRPSGAGLTVPEYAMRAGAFGYCAKGSCLPQAVWLTFWVEPPSCSVTLRSDPPPPPQPAVARAVAARAAPIQTLRMGASLTGPHDHHRPCAVARVDADLVERRQSGSEPIGLALLERQGGLRAHVSGGDQAHRVVDARHRVLELPGELPASRSDHRRQVEDVVDAGRGSGGRRHGDDGHLAGTRGVRRGLAHVRRQDRVAAVPRKHRRAPRSGEA